MIVTRVPEEHVATAWIKAGKYIQSAIEASIPDDRITTFDVFEKCAQGVWWLWVVIDDNDEIIGAFTTNVTEYPTYKVLVIPWVGCEKNTILKWHQKMLDVMEDVAKKLDCKYLEGYGKDTWAGLLSREGWRKSYSVFEKEID